MVSASAAPKTFMEKVLDGVERVGNKVPHPAVIFVILIGIVIVLSHVFYLMGAQRHLPDRSTRRPTRSRRRRPPAQSLLTADGIRFMFAGVVQNFMDFNAVGVIIVAMLGVGVAEEAGLVEALIRKLVMVAPREGADLHPGVRRHPVEHRRRRRLSRADSAGGRRLPQRGPPSAGRSGGSFAAVAAVFSVNILIKPLDGILTGITNDAIHLRRTRTELIDLTANLWFSVASV